MYLAFMEPGTCFEFINHVSFRGPDGVVERGLLNDAGRLSGRAQAAVRPISWADFNRIVLLGFDERQPELPRMDELDVTRFDGEFKEGPQAPFLFDQARERVTQLSSRPFRNRLFRQLILKAYDKRCAMTA